MNQVLRAFNATIDDVNPKDRTIVAKVGTGDLDRYATVIDPKGIDLRSYLANPVVLFSHGSDPMRGSLPVGRNLWIRVDRSGNGRLIAKTQFRDDEFSRNLYECYKEGWMRGWSVSILPKDFGAPTSEQIRARPDLKSCEIYYATSELAEYSAVSVPGNAAALSDEELRSLTNVVSRGIPVPDDVQKAIDRLADESRVQVVVPADIVTLTDVEAPAEEPAVEPVIQEDASESRDVPETEDRASDAKCKDDDEDEDEDEDEADDEAHEDDKEDKKKPKGKDKPKDEDRSVIELPPLVGARTFQQVYHSLVQEENEFRSLLLRRMQEHIDWLHGKV